MKTLPLLIPLFALAASTRAAEVDFAHQVAPILKKHCAECHTGAKKKGGLSMDTREKLLEGGENGPVVKPGDAAHSKMLEAILSTDPDLRMPPKGDRVPPESIAALRAWIDAGAAWEPGFAFTKPAYEPPLKPRRPDLPAARPGRDHPIDRILDADLARHKRDIPGEISDEAFLRRAHLDLIGLLPTPEERAAFLLSPSPGRRAALVESLLARRVEYTEHWLTFWNDLLRNDYGGTGFITGGRRQVSAWLYEALLANKRYDQMARELIAPPNDESRGFADGIKWRGEVSAGQTVEIQFSQSVSQSFLGINMKCASCHDSFVDRWKLTEAFGLAAVYATRPLELHRCDIPTGQMAKASWLFPELGQIDAAAPQPKRLEQLASLMTHPENGRFARTLVNRLWQRLLGHGIVHPVDAMQTAPWNADLLDHLAVKFQEDGYDIQKILAYIASSRAYQSQTQVTARDTDDHGYVYAGPRARRLSAEQFVDAVWQLTGTAPAKFDAPVKRVPPGAPGVPAVPLQGKWIWSSDLAPGQAPASGLSRAFRLRFDLAEEPRQAGAVITADNEYTLYVNGKKLESDKDWENVESVALKLNKGKNEILIVAVNAGSGPNLAAVYFEALLENKDGTRRQLATGPDWEWTDAKISNKGAAPADAAWKPSAEVNGPWGAKLAGSLASDLTRAGTRSTLMVRAALLKSDFLMRTLGRPNRDQIVSMRPNDLTTLEAIDLANGPVLADALARGAERLLQRDWESPDAFAGWLFEHALSRAPTPTERTVVRETLAGGLNGQNVQDLVWSVLMMPEFLFVR